MQYVSKDEEQDRTTNREVETKQGSKETMNISDSGLYYKVTISSQEECDLSSLQQIVQNDTFCDNNRRNIC